MPYKLLAVSLLCSIVHIFVAGAFAWGFVSEESKNSIAYYFLYGIVEILGNTLGTEEGYSLLLMILTLCIQYFLIVKLFQLTLKCLRKRI
jgi:hypothetical protein